MPCWSRTRARRRTSRRSSTTSSAKRAEGSIHRKVFRPWGWYDGVDAGERFQVKRIVVKPGHLSLQMHHHRAEHWIVVRGTAKVTRGDETFLVSENESTFIPLGTHHRLENPGRVPLEMIEVQSGSYLGEDDIVRFEDVYGRAVGAQTVQSVLRGDRVLAHPSQRPERSLKVIANIDNKLT
jgi:mannose-6-phosphate isomerase-like protein (cupin superfamily)